MDASGAYAEIAGCAQRLHAHDRIDGGWSGPSADAVSTTLIEREAPGGYQTCVSYDVGTRSTTPILERTHYIHCARIGAARCCSDSKQASGHSRPP